MNKPFSVSCEKNKIPILEVLKMVFDGQTKILEFGTGTGQHAVFFAEQMSKIIWQTSDLSKNHIGINAWIKESGLNNVLSPLKIDVSNYDWGGCFDSVFTANTFHIIPWDYVVNILHNVSKVIHKNGYFCVYGPFNYNNNFTSKSNRDFDSYLKSIDLNMGIRSFDQILLEAEKGNLELNADYEMPSNNRMLVFNKF